MRPIVNSLGYRVGESHPRAELSDHEVDLLRTIREEDKIGWKRLSKMFEIPVRTARDICAYKNRAQTPHMGGDITRKREQPTRLDFELFDSIAGMR